MHLLILGGNSDIGLATAHTFAERGEVTRITLASREMPLLEKRAKDLAVRYGVETAALPFDALDFAGHAAFFQGLDQAPDIVIAAFGVLGDQEKDQSDWKGAERVINVNFLGVVSCFEIAAAAMEARGGGVLIGISSVAGVRGRKKNYIYGAAKAGMNAFLSGLRQRLAGRGVRVITVMPGFTRTKMTDGLEMPERLTADSEEVARDIHKAFKGGADVVYSTWIWRYVMWIIRHLPEPIFKKTNV